MKKNFILTISLAVYTVSLVGSYYLGVGSAPNADENTLKANRPIDDQPRVESEAHSPESTVEALENVELGAIGSAIEGLFANVDKNERRYGFDRILENLDTNLAMSLLAEFELLPSSPRKTDMMLQLFAKWGEVDGAIAYGYARDMKGRERLEMLSVTAGGWAKVAPNQAWEALMIETNNGKMRIPSIGPILERIAQVDVQGAVGFLRQCQNRYTALDGFRAIVDTVADDFRYEEAYSALSGIDDPSLKNELTNELFKRWGRFDLNSPLAAIEGNEDSESSASAMKGLLVGWANVDGQAAFDYAIDNIDNPIVAENLSAVAVEWGKSASAEDLEAIVLKATQNEMKDQILRDGLRPLARADPKLAAEHALTIGNEADRSTSVREVMSIWSRSNLKEAEEYYYSISDKPSQVKAVISMVDPLLADKASPERVFNLISVFENDADRERALMYMANLARRSNNRSEANELTIFLKERISDIEGLSPRAKFGIRRALNN